MTSRDFCYWLQGYLEIVDAGASPDDPPGNPADMVISRGQAECIRRHLALVFKHEIDPSHGLSTKYQDMLTKVHDGLLHPTGHPTTPQSQTVPHHVHPEHLQARC